MWKFIGTIKYYSILLLRLFDKDYYAHILVGYPFNRKHTVIKCRIKIFFYKYDGLIIISCSLVA